MKEIQKKRKPGEITWPFKQVRFQTSFFRSDEEQNGKRKASKKSNPKSLRETFSTWRVGSGGKYILDIRNMQKKEKEQEGNE